MAVEFPGPSLCPNSYPVSVLLYTASFALLKVSAIISDLYFLILYQYISGKYLILHRVQPV